ncbi:UNVERIFIED_CONTAM: hypothetical protein FKN15_020387 [Acipenser sinensis]
MASKATFPLKILEVLILYISGNAYSSKSSSSSWGNPGIRNAARGHAVNGSADNAKAGSSVLGNPSSGNAAIGNAGSSSTGGSGSSAVHSGSGAGAGRGGGRGLCMRPHTVECPGCTHPGPSVAMVRPSDGSTPTLSPPHPNGRPS